MACVGLKMSELSGRQRKAQGAEWEPRATPRNILQMVTTEKDPRLQLGCRSMAKEVEDGTQSGTHGRRGRSSPCLRTGVRGTARMIAGGAASDVM